MPKLGQTQCLTGESAKGTAMKTFWINTDTGGKYIFRGTLLVTDHGENLAILNSYEAQRRQLERENKRLNNKLAAALQLLRSVTDQRNTSSLIVSGLGESIKDERRARERIGLLIKQEVGIVSQNMDNVRCAPTLNGLLLSDLETSIWNLNDLVA